MNLTDTEIKSLEAAQSEQEFNAIIDEIRNARNGAYPPDWFKMVISPNLLSMKRQEWSSR